MELRKQCQQFAVDLLHQSRSSQELAFILNHDPDSPPYEEGEHMKLARLELAIQYKQKKVQVCIDEYFYLDLFFDSLCLIPTFNNFWQLFGTKAFQDFEENRLRKKL
jgi:hypothetical protein